MAVETIDYPYRRGIGGISFEEVFQHISIGNRRGSIIGGSGRILEFELNPISLRILDCEIPDIKLCASIDVLNGVVFFELRTRLNSHRSETFDSEKHPDFYAGRFVGLSLDYFSRCGYVIGACRGSWYPISDNYWMFMESYGKSHDKVEAALSTWSGKTFSSYGFSRIAPHDVVIEDVWDNPPHVTALFKKG